MGMMLAVTQMGMMTMAVTQMGMMTMAMTQIVMMTMAAMTLITTMADKDNKVLKMTLAVATTVYRR